MRILVFDTCLDKMYVTLAENEKILTSKIVENKDNKYHSAFLISTIKEVLQENNMTPKEIDVLGTNIGPGSFTGIRACTTVARVMAQQLKIPAIGISSLEILSKCAADNDSVAVVLDARKNSGYFFKNGNIQGAIQLDVISQELKQKNYTLITDDKLQPILGGKSYQQTVYPLGEYLADLVYKKIQTNDLSDLKWQNLKPLYIQPPPVFNK